MPPAPLPRLVATDLDGTLLRSDGSVSERSARVLADLEAAGVAVVFVTGRPMRWMAVVRAHVGAHGLAVCSNGAVVIDLHTDAVVLARPVPGATGLAVLEEVRSVLPEVRFATEGLDGFAMEPGYPTVHPPAAGSRILPLADLLDRAPVKIMARGRVDDPDAFLAAVTEIAGERLVATRSDAAAMVELSAAGVTKASTLELLCARFGIGADEVVAFGDMPNDLPMLRWAGRSYAVAGAHPALDAVVTDRTAGNDEDGVAIALERLFDLPSAGRAPSS